MDLFASRLNFQLKPYVAYQPDPEAHAINAFHISWKGYTFYAFPPFSVIQRVLQKISDEEATGLLVVPHWPTQTWWPYLMNMLIDFPLMLPKKEDTLYLPAHPHLLHTLHKKLQLLVCHLSGISLQTEEFRLGLQRSSCNPGERVHKSSTRLTTSDGKSSVVQGKLVSHIHMPHVDSWVNNSVPVHWINTSNDLWGQEVTWYVVMLLFPGFTLHA